MYSWSLLDVHHLKGQYGYLYWNRKQGLFSTLILCSEFYIKKNPSKQPLWKILYLNHIYVDDYKVYLKVIIICAPKQCNLVHAYTLEQQYWCLTENVYFIIVIVHQIIMYRVLSELLVQNQSLGHYANNLSSAWFIRGHCRVVCLAMLVINVRNMSTLLQK